VFSPRDGADGGSGTRQFLDDSFAARRLTTSNDEVKMVGVLRNIESERFRFFRGPFRPKHGVGESRGGGVRVWTQDVVFVSHAVRCAVEDGRLAGAIARDAK
jgi:hypothetical protein